MINHKNSVASILHESGVKILTLSPPSALLIKSDILTDACREGESGAPTALRCRPLLVTDKQAYYVYIGYANKLDRQLAAWGRVVPRRINDSWVVSRLFFESRERKEFFISFLKESTLKNDSSPSFSHVLDYIKIAHSWCQKPCIVISGINIKGKENSAFQTSTQYYWHKKISWETLWVAATPEANQLFSFL